MGNPNFKGWDDPFTCDLGDGKVNYGGRLYVATLGDG